MLPSFPPYHALNRDEELELANLNEQAEQSSQETIAYTVKQKWHLPPWAESLLASPRLSVQKQCWVASAIVLMTAGLLLAILRPASTASPPGTGDKSNGGNALSNHSATAVPFPSVPWLQPTGFCSLGSSSLSPAAEVHSPLGYRVYLSFLEHHFAAGATADAHAADGFTAASNVTLAVHRETACVRLHVSNLTFTAIHAELVAGGEHQQHAAVCLCGDEPGCLVTVCGRLFKKHPADPDSWLLSLGSLTAPAGSTLLISTSYIAHFSSSGVGVWRSGPFNTTTSDGGVQQQVLISSQLEPKGARTLFPCMDEPKHKAPIVILVEAPNRLSILSNMPEAQQSITSGNRALVEFLPSPPMSTYLMAVVVGDMQSKPANTTNGPAIRVWFPNSQLTSDEAAAVPLQLAVAAFDHYTRYTRVPQPLRKFDLVAVPGKSGAMENWGLLLFDAERLLYSLPGAWSLFRCASVVCHEVAHQWFGNLVTAARWSDLLVNEGLASLLEYGCLAQVLREAVGVAGAAALMRRAVTPHGRSAGVHEGPHDKAMTYDSLPTASPLLGSLPGSDADVGFGVLVYSKAATMLALWTQYAASGSASKTSFTPAMRFGPVSQLIDSSPPRATQVALQQYLQQHIYGSASAQQVLQLFISQTPDDLSSNDVAVLAGLRAPGLPLMMVGQQQQQQQNKVSVTSGRRFCQWGLLTASVVDQLLAGTANMTAAAAAAGTSSVLACPLQLDDPGDRAVPWTPVFLSQLTIRRPSNVALTNSSVGSKDDSQMDDISILGERTRSTSVCGVWHVIKQDTQQLELPTGVGCLPANTAAAASSSSSGLTPLIILEGDGGWGLYRTVYHQEQRAGVRGWVASQLVQQMMPQTQQQQQQQVDEEVGSSTDNSNLNLRLLFIASRLLDDQAAVGLSPFGNAPGWEVKAATHAAARAAAAAAARASHNQSGTALFGHVLYTLLVPLLSTYDALLDRVVKYTSCWRRLQAELSTLLSPVAAVGLKSFTTSSLNSAPLQGYVTSGHFLGAMSLNTLITTTALVDKLTADKVCGMFNDAVAAANLQAGGVRGILPADDLMSGLPADLQAAVLTVAASRPDGCQLDLTVDEVDQLLRVLYLTSPDPAVCTTAAIALAHSSNTAVTAGSFKPSWQLSLSLLLGIEPNLPGGSGRESPSLTTPAAVQMHNHSSPACGVAPAAHAVEVAKIVSRAILSSGMQQAATKREGVSDADEDNDDVVSSLHQVGPVLDYVMHHWSSLVASVGLKVSQQLVEEVAVQEVVSWEQWQKLADWIVIQCKQRQADEHAAKQQRQWMQSVLGGAWSTMVWVNNNRHELCST